MGPVFMLLASASFATMAAFIKAIGMEVPLSQKVFLRCLLAVPLLLVALLFKKRPLMVRARSLLVVRSLFGMTAMGGFFYALTHMPLADSVFLGRSQPLLLALMAPLVVGERAPREAWLAIFTGLAGVALIMKPAMAWPTAAWVALGAASCAAMAQLLVRRLNRTDYPLTIVFNFTLLTALLSGTWSIPHFVPMDGRQWLFMGAVAVFACTGQRLMTVAYRRDRAPAVAAASYSSIILSVIYGYFFWGDVPHLFAWFGGCCIIFGGILLVRSRRGILEPADRINTL